MQVTLGGKRLKKPLREYLPCWLTNVHSLFYFYGLLVVLGVIFFAYTLFDNYFVTAFTGDYCAQQFSFYTNGYDDWWHFFKTGEFVLYDENTFLGVNNLGSNSFYYLLDPFFLPILLFPRQIVPQGMAVLTIFKMATAGLMFFFYIRYMGASRTASKISAIAYAFSGWTAWYLWFNHFTEITIVFPLILLGVERILREKKPWLLMVSICLMGFVNYFFCICFTLCAFLYAMFRYFQRIKENNWKNNLIILGIGFVGFAVGLLMAMAAMMPGIATALNSSRAETSSYAKSILEALKEFKLKELFKLLTSWEENATYLYRDKARPFYFLIELMYPVMSDRGVPLLDYNNQYGSYDNVSGSLYCYIPILMMFIPALFKSIREKHFSPLIATALFIFAILTPFAYYVFFGFTQPYSRWFLFPVICLITYSGLYLDHFKEDDKPWTLEVSAGVLLVLAIVAGIFSGYIVKKYGYADDKTNDYFEERIPLVLGVILMSLYIVGVYIVLRIFRKKPSLKYIYYGFITAEIFVMGVLVIEGHGVANYAEVNGGLDNNNALHALVEKTSKTDPNYYRSYSSLASSSATNDGMRNGYNGASFFHSLYNYNTDDFRNMTYISTGSWTGVYMEKRVDLDTLLGMKYYYVLDDYLDYYKSSRTETMSEHFTYNVPFGYIDITDQYGSTGNHKFRVYKNTNYIDFALSFDSIYGTENNVSVISQENLFLQSAIIKNSDKNNHLADRLVEEHPDLSLTDTYTSYFTLVSPDKTYTDNQYALTYYDIKSQPAADGSIKNASSLGVDEMIGLDYNTSSYDKFSSVTYPNKLTQGDYSRYIAVITCPVGKSAEKYSADGYMYYIKNSYESQKKVDIYLVDDNGKVITYDNHTDYAFSSSWSSKSYRAFYVSPTYSVDENGKYVSNHDAPHIKKIVIVSRNYKLESNYNFYYGTYNDYLARLQKFYDNPITDIHYRTNHFDFKTNFAKERIVVTRLAYEEGFTLKMTDSTGKTKEIETFIADGGFVGFISGVGECSYTLDFYPPGLTTGSNLSAIGIALFFSTLLLHSYLNIYLRQKNLIYSENIKRKKKED